MSKLVSAIQEVNNTTTTENGAGAYRSSLNACVDLFFKINASRGKDVVPDFMRAFYEDADVAIRILLNSRDVREGAGERQIFRDVLAYLANHHIEIAQRVIKKIPELGRWDDILVVLDTPVWPEAVAMISTALAAGDGLCAKWMPRKGVTAAKLRKALGMSPRGYRKTLVSLTNVVETPMCAKEWGKIDYSKVPSVASARYQQAFQRNDSVRYEEYVQALVRGDEGIKINAGAVYPYDVVKSLHRGNTQVANEQWKALPDFVPEGVQFLPVVDVSGSMGCAVGGNPSVTCMDVAVSLGLYLSERNKGIFKDAFITFSREPKMQILKGSLYDRNIQLRRSEWGINTDVEAVFKLIAIAARKHKLTQEDLPEYVIILSDMQFDVATLERRRWRVEGDTGYEMAKEAFNDAGYECPKLIFWNLKDYDNVPVTFSQSGVALVSGCSPSIMKNVLAGNNITPVSMMMDTVMVERYNW